MKQTGICIGAATVLGLAWSAIAQPLDDDVRRAYQAIEPAAVYSYCQTLCLPRYEGRYTGTESYAECARWVGSEFKKWGLAPMPPKGGYLQAFPAPHSIIDRAAMTLFLPQSEAEEPAPTRDGKEKTWREVPLQVGEDFLPMLFSDRGDYTAGMVFAGWGIHAPEIGYDDYADLDPKGKFVLCFRGTPDNDDHRYEEHDHHRKRMRTAKNLGALGLIYIYGDVHANPNGDRIEGFLPASITEKAADQILQPQGVTSAELRKRLRESKRPGSIALAGRIRLEVEARHFPEAVGYNVAACLPGSDPALKNECLIIGAHLDHCGRHAGLLFGGAEDNASGSAALMGVARAFSRLPRPPRRSVVFVLFGGEEMGLLGSSFFAEHPPPGWAKMCGMFNLDMVGAGDGSHFACSWDQPQLEETIEQADQVVNTIRGSWTIRHVGVRSSDFAPFFQLGVPCANFSSNGPHLHYHQPGDTIYRINPDMLADIARLTFLSGYRWANRATP